MHYSNRTVMRCSICHLKAILTVLTIMFEYWDIYLNAKNVKHDFP